ncbi:cytoplasmic asparaginase I [Psychromonas sp. CNPT3]|uniref:asparaginase n=1 Tax=Psychromonas sp. CNPT3 TaxID=314282 RepID=UPI0002C05CE2|nr:asparaginase [Psychromonas sp. CNPT3]AGH82298.1 cytoplasmic asparaginase I [Psychromonas sp. CNPT3]
MAKKKRIYIAYTGGTIGMKPSKEGFVPVAGYLSQTIADMPEFFHEDMPDFEIYEYDPLIDSANVSPDIWQTLALDIQARYHDFDGFIILHGTDTMSYTASALSFVFENLSKPVIITGSQIPLSQLRTDARINLLNALYIAAYHPINEVSLFFNNQLFRGNRSSKQDADGFDAFVSPNYPALLEAGIEIRNIAGSKQELLNTRLRVSEIKRQSVLILPLFPGIDWSILENVLKGPLQALVLLTYGIGNAQQDEKLLTILKEATDRGVLIVNCSQCLKGKVNMGGYATGNSLQAAGVISGLDMTTETVITKLYYLLSQDLPTHVVAELLTTNLRGELS